MIEIIPFAVFNKITVIRLSQWQRYVPLFLQPLHNFRNKLHHSHIQI